MKIAKGQSLGVAFNPCCRMHNKKDRNIQKYLSQTTNNKHELTGIRGKRPYEA